MLRLFNNICHFTLLIVCLGGCSTNADEDIKIPSNIMSEEVFTKVLVDFALAESATNLNVKNVSILSLDSTYAFNPLKENHISKSKYDSTILFYAHNTKLYKKIYENVLATLSEMQTKRETHRKDSASK
jgi:hypothetical protein